MNLRFNPCSPSYADFEITRLKRLNFQPRKMHTLDVKNKHLKGPFTYLAIFRVNYKQPIRCLLVFSLTFQRQLWSEKKADFLYRIRGQRYGTFVIYTI